MSLFSVLAEVLFIGHSLVGPTLPDLVEAGLARMEEPAEVEAQIINGAPLAYAWDHSAEADGVDGRAELVKGGVTDLVLTEAIPLAAQVEWNDSDGLVKRWAEAAQARNPEVRVWLYETWHSLESGTSKANPDDPGSGVPWRQRLSDDLSIWQAIAGKDVGIIPAGQAMGLLADEIAAGRVPGLTDVREVFADDIHPNGKGLYFVAMVHLAALTGRSPEGLPAKLMRSWPSRDAIIDDALAAAFQRIAWQSVQGLPAQLSAIDVTAQNADPAGLAPAVEVLPEAALAAPDLAPITNPNLMLGLAGVNDWSVQQPFLDVMKTARPWVGHKPGQWGGWEEADLRAAGALDADGWPLRIPEGVDGLSTLILTDLPPDAGGVAGRYLLTYDGVGELSVEGRAQVVEAGPGRILFDFTPGEGMVLITLRRIEPTDPIRHIRVVREDRADLLAAGEIFNPDWLARIKGVRGLRFMDWMATNNSTLSRAEDRPKPADYTWARAGVPIEVIVALANQLRAEPWLTLPHAANDALVKDYARVVRNQLDPGLRVWVEFSNEVWNPQFLQAQWAAEMAKARWGDQAAWRQFYGLRAAEVMEVFAREMGGTDRMVRVVATQTGVPGIEKEILLAPLAVAEGLPPPAESFDAYAVTGYFSGLLGAEQKLPAVRQWIAESTASAEAQAKSGAAGGVVAQDFVDQHRFDAAIEKAAAELWDGSVTGVPEDTLKQLLQDTLPYHAAVARNLGLDLVMYEGGSHVVGYGPAVEDAELTEFFIALNFSDEMGLLYQRLLSGWAGLSKAPFNAFVDVYRPNKWGSWGALRHLWDDNPRWRALAEGCGTC